MGIKLSELRKAVDRYQSFVDAQAAAPVLPDGYLENAKAVAELRISLASHRISGVLAQLLLAP